MEKIEALIKRLEKLAATAAIQTMIALLSACEKVKMNEGQVDFSRGYRIMEAKVLMLIIIKSKDETAEHVELFREAARTVREAFAADDELQRIAAEILQAFP